MTCIPEIVAHSGLGSFTTAVHLFCRTHGYIAALNHPTEESVMRGLLLRWGEHVIACQSELPKPISEAKAQPEQLPVHLL